MSISRSIAITNHNEDLKRIQMQIRTKYTEKLETLKYITIHAMQYLMNAPGICTNASKLCDA